MTDPGQLVAYMALTLAAAVLAAAGVKVLVAVLEGDAHD